MMQAYILPLNDPAATLETAGGKGASLQRLAQAGLPVPGGFHVTTAAYRQFVAANDLQTPVRTALQAVDAAHPETLEQASQAIRLAFEAAPVPPEIAAAVQAAYVALSSAEAAPAVAVRSSATAEDLPGASFAGQQDTYLNVRGADAVLHAVRRGWASLWTARAIGYRLRQGIDPETVSLAVVVQALVDAEAAGVLFTANPVNGRDDQALITAAWGLGEAVVGGLVTPDTLAVDKAGGQVLERQTADKEVTTVRTEHGTEERPTPDELRRRPALSDVQAAELARLGARIEALYGMPMDIEWALEGGKIWILQARPITTRAQGAAQAAAQPPQEWPLPDPKGMYSRSSMAEHLPNPVSPLFSTLALNILNVASHELVESFGYGEITGYDYVPINGYTYMGVVFDRNSVWAMVRMTVGLFRVMMREGLDHWQAALERLAETADGWDARSLEGQSPAELLEGARDIMRATARYYTVIQSGPLPVANMSETLFKLLYGLRRRKGDPAAEELLFGLDTAALRVEKSLFDLAQWAQAVPALVAYGLEAPAERLAADLSTNQPPTAGISAQEWAEWRQRFAQHLRAYGQTAYEFDFMNPTPAETPETALDAWKVYLAGGGSNPHARQQAADRRRGETMLALDRRFTLLPKGWLRRSFAWVQRGGPAREDSIAGMGRGYPAIRRLLGELGRRFAAAGAIAAAQDIYWLYEAEVEALIGGLEAGAPLPDYRQRVAERQAVWQAQLKATPPAVLPEKSGWAKLIPWARKAESETVLKGLGASAGTVTAPARVLFGPEDFGRMQPGDVLVAVTTTPAWTPLFALASAVVTDIGGPLSHSSIVAREYGIPAVMATGMGTRRIQSGQMITVDGSAGTVTIEGNNGNAAR